MVPEVFPSPGKEGAGWIEINAQAQRIVVAR